ncbi:hypothetical protein QBC33DRAFT_344992 [Phialemonium atrogriseum]|uniref:Homeobox domain-containing protein n=1 Tax=Phialemonium atrogriseum TaxID=1093897 RepID=A0AAJ0C2W5_9PEZI|nr:uncharacterized protein QBC33DRAFT_344992 [Phialemonium atrogriseum]KAK1769163.1 hypothetical protein QBC33DRAFT_344992 [Phialemonium atrogriseum]
MSLPGLGPRDHFRIGESFRWHAGGQADSTWKTQDAGDRLSLPSIRQMIPETEIGTMGLVAASRASSSTASPISGHSGAVTTPEYTYSSYSNKRRRVSWGEEDDERASQVPRLYSHSLKDSPGLYPYPSLASARQPPSTVSPTTIPRPATESWAGPSRMVQTGVLPPIGERRRTLPNFASLPTHQQSVEDYPSERPRMAAFSSNSQMAAMEADTRPSQSGDSYGSYHPARAQSHSLRPPLYDQNSRSPVLRYPGSARVNERGGTVPIKDGKRPKRRGNLPKEATDSLRAWFITHLKHPYPTEEEKQQLLGQTGLEMNQISNWFINVRRRQWRLAVRNSQADVLSPSRTSNGRSPDASGRTDRDNGERLSDDEGSTCSDDSRPTNAERSPTYET